MTAVALSLLPVLYFFTFLYYTDPGSTFFVLLTYLLSIRKNHIHAAIFGAVAVVFRQTNIVWVGFMALGIIGENLIQFVKTSEEEMVSCDISERNLYFIVVLVKKLLLKTKMQDLFKLACNILEVTWPYLFVGILFVVFVLVNGGIVVGAKDDHQAGLHFPQIYYFSAFCGVFSFMHLISVKSVKTFMQYLISKPWFALLYVFVSSILIGYFTFAHKYLLADNRHYTFYIWSKIFMRHAHVKYILIPAYLFAHWNIFYALNHQNIVWKLSYFICLLVNLVPSMLFELRYFIIPYLIWRLNMPMPSHLTLFFEILVNLVINAATLYLFMEKPFQWDHDSLLQRFMW